MKPLTTSLGLIILTFLVFNNSMAQKVSLSPNRGMTIGFGAGKAYQKSDLAQSNGLGFDFIIGSQLYHKESAFFSVDWKFRFLAGENKSYDLGINADNSISNIRYSFFTYDLELGLTLNRLRERTRIVLIGFAGAGLTHGRTFTDLYDAGNFETHLINKAAILPTAGFFIGYQFSRSITAGFEFKTNFCLTEKNSLVGINLDNRVIAGSSLDRNSYISLGLRWTLRGRTSNNHAANHYSHDAAKSDHNNMVYTHTDPSDQVIQASLPPPSVNITDPTTDSYHTVSSTHTIWATVNHVSGPDNISFNLNGIPNNLFSYNSATKIFIANVNLREGENLIRLKATNQTSSAEDMVTITFENPPTEAGNTQDQLTVVFDNPEELALPTVRFINPAVPVNVKNNLFSLNAETQNVRGRNDIMVNLNGTRLSNFSFSANGEVSVSLLLSEGINTIDVIAKNEAGEGSGRTFITYNKPVYHEPVYQEPVYQEPANHETVYHEPVARSYPPAIRIISPVSYPFRTYERSEELRATVLNVHSKENIKLNINGINTRDFNFSLSTNMLSARVALRDGENILTIQAQNESGAEMKDQVFIKETRHCPPPFIRLIDPAMGQTNTTQQNYPLRAEVRNIAGSNQLRLTVNGKTVPYNYSNILVSSSVPLNSGLNSLTLTAINECGEDNASARITYSPPVATKPCNPPKVSFTVNEVDRTDASHELRGSISGAANKADISLTVDGKADNGFQFVPPTGDLSAKLKLPPGSHTVVVSADNGCGTDSKSESFTIDEEACGLRFNPGNSTWQFCLVTPSGTFSRDHLTNANFSYSGPATSLYILPIGGGGDAMVNGSPYSIRSGQYYLFTGNLDVTVSTKNPGSMGQWSVCINANRAPVSGNGSNRPKSPCEVERVNGARGNRNSR